jgi:hypothetical protein
MNQNIIEHPTDFMKWEQKLGKTICIKMGLKFASESVCKGVGVQRPRKNTPTIL